ncbi:hypothetical protein AYL99_02869 [Fonsecaea erecta]|uniref:Uncharacterized protein n=1 Tax=Fonsecaea erecta TaxID=1367422 RepID=A0A178ZVB4_9EURO|nr:hypothetical protein AYL99_02869 [Fonsecaea erecta]OAP63642.1 hypothetical protein AYL99_02869 [Fonsecaea erecta]
MAQTVNPLFIRLEKNVAAPPYERGWNYVERRNGLLCLVRNRKDVFRLHRPSKKRTPTPPTPPRHRGPEPEREVIIVREEDMDIISRHRRGRPEGDRLFVEMPHERSEREGSGDLGDTSPRSRPRIEVRQPLNTTPPPSPIFDTRHVDSFPYRIVQKIPVERARLRRAKPLQVPDDILPCPPVEVGTYSKEEVFDPVDLPSREPRPYHIPEPENAVWDEDMNAWVVRRSPKVRFSS